MVRRRRAAPRTLTGWLAEIRLAYADARDALLFVQDGEVGESELFHLAPSVTLKFRGLPLVGRAHKVATEAALSSYIANLEAQRETLSNPHLAFAFCYLVSHYALDLISEAVVERVMNYLERHVSRLAAPE